jgi:PAS domain S-box-containing protein
MGGGYPPFRYDPYQVEPTSLPFRRALATEQAGHEPYDPEFRDHADELSKLLVSERSARDALASVVDASPVAIVARDAEQRLTMWNPAAQQMLGWSADDVLGSPGPPMPEDELQRLESLLAEVAEGRRLTDVEQLRTRKDGTTVTLSVSYAPLYDSDGRYSGSIGMARDVGDEKRAELAIRDAEEKYRTVVENIPAITYIDVADASARTTYVSPQIETLLGITAKEWMERDYDVWLECIHPEDRERAEQAYRAAIDNRQPLDLEYRAFSRDGTQRWFRDTGTVVESNGGPGYLHGVMLDITALKEAQEDLQSSYELLGRADEQRRRLLGRLVRAQEDERQRIAVDIHDDSIQVLTALTLRLELLQASIADDDLRKALADAEDVARRSVTRLRELMFELRPPALDRDGLAASLRFRLEQIHEQHGLDCALTDRLTAELDPDTRMILYRIVQEALVNVVKHARATRVDVVLQTVARGVFASVIDDGVGFDPARRPDRIGHVGLDAMRERAEAAGGRSAISSVPDNGTCVEVFIPAEIEDAA